jgi:hypothetical protein
MFSDAEFVQEEDGEMEFGGSHRGSGGAIALNVVWVGLAIHGMLPMTFSVYSRHTA